MQWNRSARISKVLIATALLCSFSLAGSAETADDWPGFLGPGRNAQSAEPLHLPWPESGPPVRWTFPLNDTYAAPTVADGGVFVFDREGDRARLSRLDVATGEPVWTSDYGSTYKDQFGFGGGPRVAPLFDQASGEVQARVYVFGVDGRLRCHSADSGDVLWERDTEKEFGVVQNFFGVGSSPVVYRDLILVSVGGSPPGDWDNHSRRVEPNGTGIVALDKLSGAIRYRTLNDLASYSALVIAPLGGRDRVVTFARSGVWILEPASGEVLAHHAWRAKKVYSVNAATPVVVGDEIFVSESYQKGGLLLRWSNAEAGDGGRLNVVWEDEKVLRNQSLATHWNTPVARGGVLYGSHGEKSGSAELRAVDWATGKVLWKHRGLRRSNALYAAGHLVVLGEYGELVVVQATPEAYRERQRFALTIGDGDERAPLLRHPAWNAPVLANGVLYLAGADRLVALDLVPPKP